MVRAQSTHSPADGATCPALEAFSIEAGKGVLRILGTRGIPAGHGGFETFAEQFSQYMVSLGWKVYVYCQEPGIGLIRYENFNGVDTVHVPSGPDNALGSLFFDLRSTIHACVRRGVCLTLGYNTAVACILLRLTRHKTVMNMDGIEWKRQKWSLPMRIWLYLNEWFGAKFNHILVADHPEIARHLARHTESRKIRIIPYGAEPVPEGKNEPAILERLGLKPKDYALVVARPEPENSILEIIQAWSRRHRGIKLAILGRYLAEIPYHRLVLAAADPTEIVFLGAIYGHEIVAALRRNSILYVHGHQVGGTNPSLVEALSYSNPVLAHDNRFNRWVAGSSASYFTTVDECDEALGRLISDARFRETLSSASRTRHTEAFRLELVHRHYKELIESVSASKLG